MDTPMEQDIKEQVSSENFPCKSCGGNMIFDPESNSLLCQYCSSKIEMSNKSGSIAEYDFADANEDDVENWGRNTRVIKCDGCGAETVLEANSAAQFCAFCNSSNIVDNDKSAGISPESLIPFKIPEEQAKRSFAGWIKKRFFAPGELKRDYTIERLKGIYIPGWTYDCETDSTYTGEGGTYYYVSVSYVVQQNGRSVTKTRQERRVRWWPTSGEYSSSFDDVPVPASKQIDGNMMMKLEPFNREELVHYKPEYLSGFYAERYSIGLKEGWITAQNAIDKNIYNGIVRKINADEVRNLDIDTTYNDIKYKLTLLPIWISNFKYKNKAYNFMINGQTGKVEGKYPLSIPKIILTVLASLGVCGIIALVIMNFS